MWVFIGITVGIVVWLFLGNIVGFDKTPWPLALTPTIVSARNSCH
jgi:hypothetical protein